MLKQLSLLLLFFLNFSSLAQFRFGNEWINYDQAYLKLTIDKEGIYLLKKTDLTDAGFDLTNQNPKKIQLFYRGIEMAINIIGENDLEFNDNDYIAFYAKPNDGAQDAYVYKPITARPHPYTTLYSDDTAYFLTISKAGNGKRMQNAPNIDANLIADQTFTAKKIVAFTEEWNWDSFNFTPYVLLSHFEPNEGLCSKGFTFNQEPYNFKASVFLENYEKVGARYPITFETMLIGKSSEDRNIAWNLNGIQRDSLNLKNYIASKIIENIDSLSKQDTLDFDFSIQNTTSTYFQADISNSKPYDAFSAFYYKIEYPRKPIFVNNYTYGVLPNYLGVSHLKLTNSLQNVKGYNYSDFENQQKINLQFNATNSELNVFVGNTITKQNVYLSNSTLSPKKINLIKFNKINPIDYNYFIITNTILRTGAEAYATYRKSKQGGDYKVLISDINNIYDEYCFGERNPIAIKRMADYLTNTSQPKYLFLIGKAHSRTNELKTFEQLDLVPSFGYPASDVLLTSGINGLPDVLPSIPTGRLSVTTNNEIIDYLNKVIEHEYLKTNNNWQNNFLHLAGPQTNSEFNYFENELNSLKPFLLNSDLGVFDSNITTINKNPNVNVKVEVPQLFYDKTNEGVGVITYLGHGSTKSTSHNIGLVSNDQSGAGGPLKYNNKGKYPLLYINGCAAGNSFAKDNSLLADWVNTPNKGAIVGIGTSYLSYAITTMELMKALYKTWYEPKNTNAKVNGNNLYESVGNVLAISTKSLYTNNLAYFSSLSPSVYYTLLEQTILFGDPAIAVFKPIKISPLPLRLLSFNGKSIENINVLTWKTAEEKEFDGFEIEKSKDLTFFNTIGFVKSEGKDIKTELEYQFKDDLNEDYGSYYRLKMLHKNKKDTYSNIIFLQNNNENYLKIYGNPMVSNTIKFSIDNLDKNSILLTNEMGQPINFEFTALTSNNYQLVIDNSNKGMLFIEVKNTFGKKYNKKIMNLTN